MTLWTLLSFRCFRLNIAVCETAALRRGYVSHSSKDAVIQPVLNRAWLMPKCHIPKVYKWSDNQSSSANSPFFFWNLTAWKHLYLTRPTPGSIYVPDNFFIVFPVL